MPNFPLHINSLNPGTGGSGQGFYFIPESGEEVLVGCESKNAEKPFVMGAHYNGKETSGYGNSDNSIKAIHTRSGHIIKFTEDESIIITDKSGNEIHLDTTGSNINITAPETMTLNCKNMNINVSENMTTNIGMNKSDSIGMNNTESVGMMKMTSVLGDASMMITGKLTEMIEGDVHSETQQGKTVVNNEGGIETSSTGKIMKDANGNVDNRSGEKGKAH
ncbi:MAG: phage baseplate assembly protein V [Flavobacteriaceae bacterium]|nr:phage baseplate assembly protein V [Flavobacteriaceae bacterium]